MPSGPTRPRRGHVVTHGTHRGRCDEAAARGSDSAGGDPALADTPSCPPALCNSPLGTEPPCPPGSGVPAGDTGTALLPCVPRQVAKNTREAGVPENSPGGVNRRATKAGEGTPVPGQGSPGPPPRNADPLAQPRGMLARVGTGRPHGDTRPAVTWAPRAPGDAHPTGTPLRGHPRGNSPPHGQSHQDPAGPHVGTGALPCSVGDSRGDTSAICWRPRVPG